MRRPRVLMVTGAYAPEMSGASLQCRHLIDVLRDRADFVVLTTSTDPSLPWHAMVEGIQVRRITVDPASRISKLIATPRLAASFLELARHIDIVHLHGFSQKSVLIVALARLLRRPLVIKLTSFGHDDPASIRAQGSLRWRSFRDADRFIGVTPRFAEGFEAHGLDRRRFVFIPNGVDLNRFQPASPEARAQLQRELGLPDDAPVVLFVGFFSRDKNPDVLFDAWASLAERGIRSTLVFVGATRGTYYEIDASLAERIRQQAAARGLSDRIRFVERTDAIEKFYRAADVFALPTAREGLPNVLLEAMACGVPPVITRLDGVTDWIVSPGVTGELVPTIGSRDFAAALQGLLMSRERRRTMGAAARAHVEANFSIGVTAQQTLDVYRELLNGAAA